MAVRAATLARSALRELAAHKGQTALTCLSLLLGVLSVVAVQTIAQVAEQVYVRNAELARGHNGSAVLTMPATAANRAMARRVVAGLPGTVVMLRDTQAYVVTPEGEPINVMGTAGNVTDVFPYGTDHAIRPGEIVMNHNAALQLAGRGPVAYYDPNDPISTQLQPRTVIDEGQAGAVVIVPESFLGSLPPDAQMQIFHYRPGAAKDLLADELAVAASRAGLHASPPESVDVLTEIRMQLEVLRLGFLIAAAITLGVGIVAIMNVSLASLPGRAEELALRRSLGASRRDVFFLVLVEGGLLGLLAAGAVVALSIAAYLAFVRHAVAGMTVPYPLSAAVIAVATGIAAGLLAHVIPGWRASRMTIATVMRA